MKTVLVVDDKEMMRDSVCVTLERAGFTVVSAPDGAAALETIAKKRPDAVVTDMKMPHMTGIELLEKVRQIDDELPVVLMTAFGTIETAVKAMKLGAFDYLTKPFEGDELIISLKRAIEHRRLMRENAVLRAAAGVSEGSTSPAGASTNGQSTKSRAGLDRLIGNSEAMKKLREAIQFIANSHGTVLITGESGVGKEVVARAIHECSPRSQGAYLAVNCAALSSSLLESELFGHERGAFTGAEKLRKGRFELADGGTLLLDEISEVNPQIQAKLLRVLQERAFERVGSSLTIGVEVRVIATSNRDLPATVAKGDFRQDLYFRLNVLPVHVPPLRERLEDVPALANHFAAQVCAREGRAALRFAPAAESMLMAYSWPGNVRELQNICERAVVLSGGMPGALRDGMITPELIAPWVTPAAAATFVRAMPIQQIEAKPHGHLNGESGTSGLNGHAGNGDTRPLEEIEREAIVATLTRFNGHRQKTATALGIGVRTLGLKLKKWKEDKLVADTL
ncbi:MAG TPA: sigma-54 dependent transcriptional regulator [Phycisphaerales bacterium]|nr:sigma-54 dependent transcriptional regulator [Phycisphaerales bacterium]